MADSPFPLSGLRVEIVHLVASAEVDGRPVEVLVVGNADEEDVVRAAQNGHVTVALGVDGAHDEVMFESELPTSEALEASIRALSVALAGVRKAEGG